MNGKLLGGGGGGVFGDKGDRWGAWLLVLFLAAGATAFVALRAGRTLPLGLAVVASWLGLQRVIFQGSNADSSAAFLLAAASAAVALFFIVFARRRMGFHEK